MHKFSQNHEKYEVARSCTKVFTGGIDMLHAAMTANNRSSFHRDCAVRRELHSRTSLEQ